MFDRWTQLRRDVPEKSWDSEGRLSRESADFDETSFQINRVDLQEVSRERFADLLREAFPGGTDSEVAALAARRLGYSERMVLNWLKCENSPPFDVVFAIGCFVGVFKVMDVMTRGESRVSVLNKIVRGTGRVFGR